LLKAPKFAQKPAKVPKAPKSRAERAQSAQQSLPWAPGAPTPGEKSFQIFGGKSAAQFVDLVEGDSAAIANRLGSPIGEVELILGLRGKV
jgi:hypothetical protein